jgi:queuine tRNA-ribosyltransferase
MLTDSGGFQVFSLSDLSKITDDGVTFKSHIDGSLHHFSPEHSIKVQHVLDSDIIMAFDQCPPYPASRDDVGLAVRRTHEWLVRCRDYHEESGRADRQSLFGIVQGGVYEDMRIESSQFVSDMNLPGVAIGGVSVGEPTEWVSTVLEWCVPHLPVDKPRYLMGVGSPLDLIECVARGIDLFDCVLPTRLGRNGTLYTSVGKVNIKGARYARDMGPVDPSCQCAVCKRYSAAYLRHLYKSREILGCRLATYHNLSFIADLMRRIRLSIAEGTYSALRQKIHAAYESRSSW